MSNDVWLSLKDLIAQREARRARDRAEDEKVQFLKREAAKKYADALEAYQLTRDDKDAIMRRIARAFENGDKEMMLFSFPSDLCADDGRRINNSVEGWEDTLPGAARRVFEFWRDDLQQRGFLFTARVVTYPGGMPGDIGLFFSWPKELEG